MKFFEMKTDSIWKSSPRLTNWYEHFDVRDIRMETFYKLPEKDLFCIAPSEYTIFTDIISFPFLLISSTIKDVIKMYRDKAFFREVILLDQKSGESHLYYLPVFDEIENIHIYNRKKEQLLACSTVLEGRIPDLVKRKNIFWIRKGDKRHTIVSLDFAESILRRGAMGIGLQEVYLEGAEEERGRG